ncbi:hypothetical protein BHE74_00032757 [Ensete ventricosum]|nr:hypothetical protein GW17_00039963 [Ensete ventricosum]RWW60257.1 hypothetical protein BHE74_00032757 [Ensete ventricosum]RZR79853.1 hypothetical protein BHM03_00005703 [Ensete ventricosum]
MQTYNAFQSIPDASLLASPIVRALLPESSQSNGEKARNVGAARQWLGFRYGSLCRWWNWLSIQGTYSLKRKRRFCNNGTVFQWVRMLGCHRFGSQIASLYSSKLSSISVPPPSKHALIQ